MDLNHIELPMTTLTDLYRNSLVIPDGPENTVAATSSSALDGQGAWPHQGANNKQILIVIAGDHASKSTDPAISFLVRMLKPCKLSVDDVAIIERKNYQDIGYKEITQYFASRKVLLFGLTPVEFGMPVQFPEFQVQTFQKIEFMHGPQLSAIEKKEELKRSCWESLKKIFNLASL